MLQNKSTVLLLHWGDPMSIRRCFSQVLKYSNYSTRVIGVKHPQLFALAVFARTGSSWVGGHHKNLWVFRVGLSPYFLSLLQGYHIVWKWQMWTVENIFFFPFFFQSSLIFHMPSFYVPFLLCSSFLFSFLPCVLHPFICVFFSLLSILFPLFSSFFPFCLVHVLPFFFCFLPPLLPCALSIFQSFGPSSFLPSFLSSSFLLFNI